MSNYQNRLKKIASDFAKTAAVRPNAFVIIPKGTQQLEITDIKLIPESKVKFALGQLEIKLQCVVLTGEFKGAKAFMSYYLEQPEKEINGKKIPSGLATFKGVCEAMGIDLPRLDEKSLLTALKAMKNLRFIGWFNGKGNNCYFNSLLEADDMEITEEIEEEAEEEEEEVVEKPKVKVTKPKVKVEEVEEETEDSDDSEEEDDDLDLDGVEV